MTELLNATDDNPLARELRLVILNATIALAALEDEHEGQTRSYVARTKMAADSCHKMMEDM